LGTCHGVTASLAFTLALATTSMFVFVVAISMLVVMVAVHHSLSP
jgi:hypothetical protein